MLAKINLFEFIKKINYQSKAFYMKIFALEYNGDKLNYRINLGDDIQTIAAINLLPKIDGFTSRENLNKIKEPCIISMNGFFMQSQNWPPSSNVIPIPYAFHVSKKSEETICSSDGIEFLKLHEPIGCRDLGTKAILDKYGVKAYYSKCITLTFDKRTKSPKESKVYIVDVSNKLQKVIPSNLLKNSVKICQANVRLSGITSKTKREMAQQLLNDYKKNASLIITSKIHCAMPCIAMGIPVVFLYEAEKRKDYRVHIINDLIEINYINKYLLFSEMLAKYFYKKINWSPKPKEIEEQKNKIKKDYLSAYTRAIEFYKQKFN